MISTYLSDDFSTIYYYFRALAVKIAFRGAKDILDKFLGKVYERWQASGQKEVGKELDTWKRDFCVTIAASHREARYVLDMQHSSLLKD